MEKKAPFILRSPIYLGTFLFALFNVLISLGVNYTGAKGTDMFFKIGSTGLNEWLVLGSFVFVICSVSNMFGHIFTLRIAHIWVGRTQLLSGCGSLVAFFGLVHNGMSSGRIDSLEVNICMMIACISFLLAFAVAPFLHAAIVEDDERDDAHCF